MILLFALEIIALMLPPLLNWDKSRRSFVLAVRSLWLHKLRAMLSVLGIIIGTAAVIALMAFGEGSMQEALNEIKRLGATNVIIRSVKPPDDSSSQRRSMMVAYGLTYDDYERFHTISNISQRVPMRVFPCEARHLERMVHGRLIATTPQYTDVHQIEMSQGRFLTDQDQQQMDNVAVLGYGIANDLYPFGDPMGQSVRVGNHFYKIIGVIKDRMPTGGTGGSQAAEEYNHDIYVPLATARARFGEKIMIRSSGSRSGEQVELHQITLTVEADIETQEGRDRVKAVGDLVKHMAGQYHPKRDFAVTIPLDRLEAAEKAKINFTRLLVLIASISLIVGGIGIMNIMLATVTERTREIGIRRALGAKRRDITLQFLVEAVVQTTIGGIIGVGVGLGTTYLVPKLSEQIFDAHLPTRLNVPSIFLSLGVSIGVGVLFGWYPAQRAAKLDPIEALRHD